MATSQPPRLAQAEPVPGSSTTAPCFGKKKRQQDFSRTVGGPDVRHRARTAAGQRDAAMRGEHAPDPALRRRTAAALASGITSCSLPVSTHSGFAPRSVFGQSEHRSMSPRGAASSRVRGALGLQRPSIALRRHGHDAGDHLQRHGIARTGELAHDVRTAQRRMTCEGHFERRRENANPRARTGATAG